MRRSEGKNRFFGNLWTTFRRNFLKKRRTGIRAPWGPFALLKKMPEEPPKFLGNFWTTCVDTGAKTAWGGGENWGRRPHR